MSLVYINMYMYRSMHICVLHALICHSSGQYLKKTKLTSVVRGV